MRPNPYLCLWGAGAICLLAGASVGHAQTVVFVDRDAPGPAHDGTTWCSAFVDLQDALDIAVSNTVIRVADGVYKPDKTGLANPREATFSLINGVEIAGGYAGCGAPNPDERDVALHETILSGDLNGNDTNVAWLDDFQACYTGSSVTITPGCEGFDYNFDDSVNGNDFTTLLALVGYTDNVYHVVTSSGNAASASLSGCTITHGNATGTGVQRNGGGMYVVSGAPSVTACTFRYNAAANGGGVYNDLNALASFSDCTFTSNVAYSGASGGFGGGALNFAGIPTFIRCVFLGNGSGNGGGIFSQNSSFTARRGWFSGNRATVGAGLYCASSNPGVSDTVFTGNLSLVEGGGIAVWGGNPRFTNVSLSQNEAFFAGGISVVDATVTIDNSILWGNVDNNGAIETSQIQTSASTVTVRSTCVEGLSVYAGHNNIGSDPMFLDGLGVDGMPGTTDDDLRLLAESPCIDTGNNSAVSTTTDLDGNARIEDGDGEGTATVDMGAYEREYVPPPVCYSSRDLSIPRLYYEQGVTKTVYIVLLPEAGTTALGVEDIPPPGWVDIANISNGGSYDAVAHKVKWGPLFSPFPVELSYDITPPADAVDEVCFSGVTSANGDQTEPTCGDTCIKAQPCPFLPADDTQPVCAGCADCTCGTCQDGRVELCEMIGYACAWKTGCSDDIGAMTRAAFLWKVGEFHCWDADQANWIVLPAPPATPGCCETALGLTAAASHAGPKGPDRDNSAVVHALGIRSIGNAQILNVPVTIHTNDRTVAVGLEIEVPDGWKVIKITDGGVWDDINRKVKWGPFFEDLSRMVRFSVRSITPKPTLEGFAGTVSFDGFNEPVIFAPPWGE